MARHANPLLGQGERLTTPVTVPRGSGNKQPPYSFSIARQRVAARATTTTTALDALPPAACPDDQAVAVLTMHPRYVSKSDFPLDLINAIGAKAIGSRSRVVKPDEWGTKKHPDEAITEEYFISAKRSAFKSWTDALPTTTSDAPAAATLQEVEDFTAFTGAAKLRSIPAGEDVLLEVALHTLGPKDTLDAFEGYAQSLGATPMLDHRVSAHGLTFLPVRVASMRARRLADFAFVRVARGMPQLRPYRPTVLRSTSGFPFTMGSLQAQTTAFKALIFDGGLPKSARATLAPVVKLIEPAGLAAAVPDLELHGLWVTSAFLFGPIASGATTPPPLCSVDHVRVLDQQTGANQDVMYLDVLNRITTFLDEHPNQHDFVNISLGPDLSIEDDEITAWTALLDERFAGGTRFATIAVGNSGERDRATNLARIQPPADCVNVISVGACTTSGAAWQRASYSSIGPGRTPGRIKPDGVDYGGCPDEPFGVMNGSQNGTTTWGTSFAAPSTMRTSAAVKAGLGAEINLLGVRALMVHRATPHETETQAEVGWGRFEADPQMLLTCEDDEALTVYQGELPVSQHLRCPLPIPDGILQGDVFVSATLVISPEVDPSNSSTYTRSGLEVIFRPDSTKFRKTKPGEKKPQHAQSKSFFSLGKLFGASEMQLRDDAHKWEPCLKRVQKLRAKSMKEPVFDVYYHHRAGGAAIKEPKPIKYALIVGMRAPKVPDFYNRVVRAYTGILVPLKSKIQVRIR